MRVLVDLRSVHSGLTGIGRYAQNLGLSLERCGSAITVEALASRSGVDYMNGTLTVRFHVPSSSGPEWENMGLPDLLSKLRIDLYHTPLFVLPSVRVCRYVCTVHDVIPISRPDLSSPDFSQFFHRHIGSAMRNASHVVAVSEYSRQDLLRHVTMRPERVTAIHEPVNPLFRPVPESSYLPLLKEFNLEPGFLLSVGSIDRRKNLTALVEAYALLREMKDGLPPLVFVGAPSGDGFDLAREVAKRDLQGCVRMLGRVSDDALVRIYSSALALVFPSLYEGFGLPVVEAMASGTPVIANRATSIVEVAGDAAILVRCEDPREIRDAIALVAGSPSKRAELRVKGLARVTLFTLERHGAALVDLYDRVLREVA